MLSSFPLFHNDFVHDIAFDFYGKRIATCSSDQKIRIWEKKLINGDVEWVNTDALYGERKGHNGAVLKVSWADPEFGSVLASCGFDRQVIVWAEEESKDFSKNTWEFKMNWFLKEVVDIRFAPK